MGSLLMVCEVPFHHCGAAIKVFVNANTVNDTPLRRLATVSLPTRGEMF